MPCWVWGCQGALRCPIPGPAVRPPVHRALPTKPPNKCSTPQKIRGTRFRCFITDPVLLPALHQGSKAGARWGGQEPAVLTSQASATEPASFTEKSFRTKETARGDPPGPGGSIAVTAYSAGAAGPTPGGARRGCCQQRGKLSEQARAEAPRLAAGEGGLSASTEKPLEHTHGPVSRAGRATATTGRGLHPAWERALSPTQAPPQPSVPGSPQGTPPVSAPGPQPGLKDTQLPCPSSSSIHTWSPGAKPKEVQLL